MATSSARFAYSHAVKFIGDVRCVAAEIISGDLAVADFDHRHRVVTPRIVAR